MRRATRFDRDLATERSLEVRLEPMEDGGLVMVAADITERKRAERQLQEAYSVIRESVNYASQIQRSMLPAGQAFDEVFAEWFAIWEPRDIVGGDFYWLRPCTGGDLLVIADCTGHGVPGAFMTIVGTGALNQALLEHPDGDPAALLAAMSVYVQHALGQDQGEDAANDGMELGIFRIAADKTSASFAGAHFSLWRSDAAGVTEIKGDKPGIGYRRNDPGYLFTNTVVDVAPGTAFYFVTDGVTDQIGGARHRAFGREHFGRMLERVQGLPLNEQKASMRHEMQTFQGAEVRRDDLTFLGFRPS